MESLQEMIALQAEAEVCLSNAVSLVGQLIHLVDRWRRLLSRAESEKEELVNALRELVMAFSDVEAGPGAPAMNKARALLCSRRKMMVVKRGHLVEFTDEWHRHYPPADEGLVRFGVALEDEADDRSVLVRTPQGDVRARHIYAYAWAGWIPEDLEGIWEELNPEEPYNGDSY